MTHLPALLHRARSWKCLYQMFIHQCFVALHILNKYKFNLIYLIFFRLCFTGKRKRAASSTTNTRPNFSNLQIKMVLEALSKGNRHPSHSITEKFAKLNNVSGANVNVKVCFNNKRQLDARKQNRPS